MTKRLVDVAAAGMGLLLLAPIFVLIAVVIRLDSAGPAFFRQERVGQAFRRFRIYKFRTMVWGDRSSRLITTDGDPRVTRIGSFLRSTKIDELPQLINVLKGEMSLVGPRPEVPRYVEIFRDDYSEILRVRPGITDLASLKYRDESRFLGCAATADDVYLTAILPDKIRLAKEYVRRASFSFDLSLVFQTILRMRARNA